MLSEISCNLTPHHFALISQIHNICISIPIARVGIDHCFNHHNLNPKAPKCHHFLFFTESAGMSSSPASAKFVAEYAKSGRSSCKKCSKSIVSGAPRLGLVSKDPRGFDMTKWHHLNCFPFSGSNSISSPDSIKGFTSLKGCDQESVKKLVNEGAQASKKVYKTDEKEDNESEQGNLKKQKLACEEGGNLELELAVSACDIKDKYKDAMLLPKWKAFQTIIFLERDDGLHDSTKIAAFDFDGCLAKTSVKKVGAHAWSLMYPSIPEKLQCLYNDGYKLVIFTNESNIERWKNKRQAAIDSKIGRLENFIKLVKVPIQVFIACGLSSGEPVDPFRKPKPGMWKIMEKEFNSGLPVDIDQSFYVGDAAGRPDDHSDADIKFAQVLKLEEDQWKIRERIAVAGKVKEAQNLSWEELFEKVEGPMGGDKQEQNKFKEVAAELKAILKLTKQAKAMVDEETCAKKILDFSKRLGLGH